MMCPLEATLEIYKLIWLDLVHSQIVGTGSENGGLYLFDYDSPKSSMCSNIGNMSTVCYVSKSLWHSRLGHPSDQALDVLQGNLRFTKNSSKSPCDICHKAKQTREPFPLKCICPPTLVT
ncbi:ribonuclease H-like domain-containing protein [Tanacetum coccineum]